MTLKRVEVVAPNGYHPAGHNSKMIELQMCTSETGAKRRVLQSRQLLADGGTRLR